MFRKMTDWRPFGALAVLGAIGARMVRKVLFKSFLYQIKNIKKLPNVKIKFSLPNKKY